jgi:hypothetical protein
MFKIYAVIFQIWPNYPEVSVEVKENKKKRL